jgi:hypothetical protein
MSASAPAFRPVVKADGPRLISGGPVLLFDVLAQDRDGNGEEFLSTVDTTPAGLWLLVRPLR